MWKGYKSRQRREHIFKWLKQSEYSVSLLQETHSTPQHSKDWVTGRDGKCFFSGLKSDSEGVAFLINRKSNIQVSNFKEIYIGRVISIKIKIHQQKFLLIDIYGQNSGNDKHILPKLEDYISNNTDKSIMIGRDFNTVLKTEVDIKKW